MSPAPRRSWTDRVFRVVLRAFPFDFRADHGRDMEQTLRAQHREARRQRSVGALVRLWLDVIRDVLTTAPREHVAILRQDVGYALRGLRRAPVFTISAVLTLAIGMSAITGMAAVLNAVMFGPLAVDRPEQLISISNQNRLSHSVSYQDFQDYRAETSVLSDAIGYVSRAATLSGSGRSERITIELVTDNYFSMLGVRPAVGRLIQPNEGRAPGGAPVLVLSYDYWQSRFGGDPSVVGRSVRLGSHPFTIVPDRSIWASSPKASCSSRRLPVCRDTTFRGGWRSMRRRAIVSLQFLAWSRCPGFNFRRSASSAKPPKWLPSRAPPILIGGLRWLLRPISARSTSRPHAYGSSRDECSIRAIETAARRWSSSTRHWRSSSGRVRVHSVALSLPMATGSTSWALWRTASIRMLANLHAEPSSDRSHKRLRWRRPSRSERRVHPSNWPRRFDKP